MKNTGIEDISIDNSIKNDKKRNKGFFIVLLLLLLIVIIGIIIIYKLKINNTVGTKQLFFESISNINSNQISNSKFYKSLFERLAKEDATIINNITYTTNDEIELLKEFEQDKFSFTTTTNTNIDEDSFITDVNIKYSGNDFFKFNILSDKKNIGVMSDNISKKYIGISYNEFKKIYKIGNPVDYLKQNEDIDLTNDEFKKIIKKYSNYISNQIDENNFSFKDNIILDNTFGNIAVKEYKLELSQDELKQILIGTLNELKNDEDLLKGLLSNNSNNSFNIEVRTNNGEKNIINEPNEISNNIDENTQALEESNPEILDENIDVEQNISVAESIMPDGVIINLEDIKDKEKINLDDILPKINNNSYYKDLANIIIGKKIDMSIKSFQNKIDQVIEKIQKLEGNGIILKIYVSENGTEKIVANLPNESDFEIEFHNNSNQDNTCKITYLYLGNNGKFSFSDDIKEEQISIEKIESDRQELPISDKKNGFSIELNNTKNESQNSFNITYNYIENEIINKKISFSVNTTGNIYSKVFKNDILLRNSGSEKDELIIENTIRFDEGEDVPILSDDNFLLLDDLSEEDKNEVLQAILLQIKKVREEKKDEAELIDTNNQKYLISKNADNISTEITYEEAKNVLIEKISNMMREAVDKNEEFTLNNLVNLSIDGYNVSTTINEDSATIVIDIYTFNIDSNFALTDAN